MEALRCLPGVGPKSAQRMAFQLLQRDRSGGMRLAQSLTRAMSEIGHCADCRTFTEQDRCTICANPRRQQNGQICVVESPADIHAIEQTGQFGGRYFVLMGHLSPLDGIGPGDIGLDLLEERLSGSLLFEPARGFVQPIRSVFLPRVACRASVQAADWRSRQEPRPSEHCRQRRKKPARCARRQGV